MYMYVNHCYIDDKVYDIAYRAQDTDIEYKF